jgi:excisionase family DNA binding protein
MNRQQLATWLTDHLKQAEPLDRPSDLDDPREVAITATKKLALLGLGDGNLYRQALAVESPQDCAAVLMDCLSAIGVEPEPEPESNGLLTVRQAARRLRVSETVIRDACRNGTLRHSRFGSGRGTIRIALEALEAFQSDNQQRTTPRARRGFRHL